MLGFSLAWGFNRVQLLDFGQAHEFLPLSSRKGQKKNHSLAFPFLFDLLSSPPNIQTHLQNGGTLKCLKKNKGQKQDLMIQVSIFLFTFHYMVFGKVYDIGNLNYHHPKHVQFPTLQFQTRHYSLEHIQCSCEFHFRERVRLKNKGRQFFYFRPQLNFLEQGKANILLQREGEIEERITNIKNHY